MTTAAHEGAAPAEKRRRPLWLRLVLYALIVVVFGAAANLLGWDIRGWFHSLWNTITTISAGSLIAAILLMIVQTTATAFAWFSILSFAYPGAGVGAHILAGYAVSVALNGILPANIGTLVFLIMLTRSGRDQLRRRARRLRGGEDLLHARRRLRLPLSLPVGRRLVRHLLQLGARPLPATIVVFWSER